MPAKLTLVAYVASFYRSVSTPPYADRTLVKDAPLALAASNPQNRLAIETGACYYAPTIHVYAEQPKKEADMLYYESREANKLTTECSQQPGFIGVRSVYVEKGDTSVSLNNSLWWLKRAAMPAITTAPPPVRLSCTSVDARVLDLRPLARCAHLLSLSIQHADDTETVLLPSRETGKGPLRSLHIGNCPELTKIADSENALGSDGYTLSALTNVELYQCDKFDFTACLPHCTEIETLSGFLPCDFESRGLAALSHLLHLRKFSICCSPLTSLAGLETCRKLEVLDCQECSGLDDIASLTGLPELRDVSLAMAGISSIDGLLACPKLDSLCISSCEYLDRLPVFPVGCRLRDLNISYTALEDLSPLANCQELEVIHINNCTALRTLEPILSLPRLTTVDFEEGVGLEVVPSVLFSKGMYLNDWPNVIRFAGDYSQLESIILHECESVSSLAGLEHASQLVSAEFRRCPSLQDLSALANKTNLGSVEIDECPVTSIAWMRTCPGLRQVNLGDIDDLVDIDALFASPAAALLEALTISDCPNISATALTRFGEFRSLSHLWCSSLPFASLDWLAQCIKLRTVYVQGSAVLTGSLGALSTLPELEKLEVPDSGVCCLLPPLATVPKGTVLFPALTTLNVVRCHGFRHLTVSAEEADPQMWSARAVQVFPKLDYIEAYDTPLSDVSLVGYCRALSRLGVSKCPQLTNLTGFFRAALSLSSGNGNEPVPHSRLRYFDVDGSAVTTLYEVSSDPVSDAEALAHWCRTHWTALESLNLAGCPLTSASQVFVKSVVAAFDLEEASYSPGRFSISAEARRKKMSSCE